MYASSEPTFWDLLGNLGGCNQSLVTIYNFPEGTQEGSRPIETSRYSFVPDKGASKYSFPATYKGQYLGPRRVDDTRHYDSYWESIST